MHSRVSRSSALLFVLMSQSVYATSEGTGSAEFPFTHTLFRI